MHFHRPLLIEKLLQIAYIHWWNSSMDFPVKKLHLSLWSFGTTSSFVAFVCRRILSVVDVKGAHSGVPGVLNVFGFRVRIKLVQYPWTTGIIAAFVVKRLAGAPPLMFSGPQTARTTKLRYHVLMVNADLRSMRVRGLLNALANFNGFGFMTSTTILDRYQCGAYDRRCFCVLPTGIFTCLLVACQIYSSLECIMLMLMLVLYVHEFLT